MQKKNLEALIEFRDESFLPKVLMNEPGYRMVLLNLRAGQSVPEHSTPGTVTVYAIHGHVTFYDGSTPCELQSGEVLTIESGAPHHVESHEDSALLVLATGRVEAIQDPSEELDVREVPRPRRHPLIFQKFDALAVGDSLRLLNDHDPVPLHRQFESLRQGEASWEYIERGPAIFRIRIRRTAPSRATDAPVISRDGGVLQGIDR